MDKRDNSLRRKEREEKQEAKNGLKFVIDGAKIRCNSCTIPDGDLKANYDTASIQDKRVVTVVEKDMRSLIFKGNCKKSFMNLSPCASVMKLGEWKNPGTVYFQDELAVLLRSTIKCEYGGVDITIWDCGQRNVITNLDTLGAPVPEYTPIVYVNGYFYSNDGIYLGKISSGENVYITDQLSFLELEKGKNVEKEKVIYFTEKYGLNNTQLLDRANWAYAEGKGYIPEYYAYAMNNFQKVAKSEKNMYFYGMQDTDPVTQKVRRLDKDKYLSGGYENQSGKSFWDTRKDLSKMTSDMIGEIAAVFKTQLQPDNDPTNGSNQWRGGKGSGEMQLNLPIGSKYWHRFFKLKKQYTGQAKIITL
ncbi:PAAR-like protein [Flavobacterium aquidurense]|uniref:YD repeat protein n=1 Tax=Flavobacterium aquidurense TaxID=362413 RepID=A0A0Q0X2W2_9FLAO|nr:PAAR-like protein [Flavobacterium aquidurense]KQB42745.1 YD repeat protein [Flavobacterium aquidurense]